MIHFVDVKAGTSELRSEIDAAIAKVLSSDQYVLGPEVEAFERDWADYNDQRRSVGVGSGLDAIQFALEAVGVRHGDEVIVPANTYIATWLAVTFAGAVPVPVEPDPFDFTLAPDAVEAAITPRTTAILPVHLYGQPARMSQIRAIADRYSLAVVADGAQAHGASEGGMPVAHLADVTAWSFYPTKNLGCLGDGGAVTTDHDALADQVLRLRNYGSSAKNAHDIAGRNSRLDELQAAVLRVKLAALTSWNERRRSLADRYSSILSGVDVVLPRERLGSEHVWHLYVIRLDERDRVSDLLLNEGIATGIHYPTPPHRQRAYARMSWPELPISEELHASVLSLPMYPQLREADVEAVGEALKAAVGQR